MGIKDFMTRKLLERQMKNVPPAQRELIINAVQENPEFFEKIAKEIQEKTKEGKNQNAASMEVMRKYQGELQEILKQNKPKN